MAEATEAFRSVAQDIMLSSGFSNWLNIKPGLQPAAGTRVQRLELGYLDIRREDRKVAARKLVEIASTIEPVQNGRIYIELVNAPFLKAGGSASKSPRPLAL